MGDHITSLPYSRRGGVECGVDVRCGCAVWMCGVDVRCGCAVWMWGWDPWVARIPYHTDDHKGPPFSRIGILWCRLGSDSLSVGAGVADVWSGDACVALVLRDVAQSQWGRSRIKRDFSTNMTCGMAGDMRFVRNRSTLSIQPGHGAGILDHCVERIQQGAIPVLFQNPPTALDRIVLDSGTADNTPGVW